MFHVMLQLKRTGKQMKLNELIEKAEIRKAAPLATGETFQAIFRPIQG